MEGLSHMALPRMSGRKQLPGTVEGTKAWIPCLSPPPPPPLPPQIGLPVAEAGTDRRGKMQTLLSRSSWARTKIHSEPRVDK